MSGCFALYRSLSFSIQPSIHWDMAKAADRENRESASATARHGSQAKMKIVPNLIIGLPH
jgi:hypothetical protein